MKKLFVIAFLAGCSDQIQSDAVKSFIPGTYVRQAHHEMGTEHDTLIISHINREGHFQILRKWRYDRVINGQHLLPKYKQEKTSGLYNSEKKVLQETESGDAISFVPDQNLLIAGTTQYMKVN